MESRSEKYRKCKAEDRRMMIKKHFTEKKRKSSSKGDAKKSEKNSPESAEKSPEENIESRPPSRNSSPDPNCPICLEPLTNKSFTDSCFHTFCFTCLVEWSKVKPECPLCKQTFKSIVHNVQSDFSYDEYHIHGRTSLWTICASEPRFRYASTMTASRFRSDFESYRNTYHNQIESHRMRYAPHAVRLYSSSQNMSRVPCNFRVRVYNRGIWVRPASGNRVRTVSPDFFRRNPACTHRLLPWLNRELVALLQNNETQVTFVLELIMALIARYEITSEEFFIHIEPYLGDKTRHFIHELYNFAISPHDMDVYDMQSIYSNPTNTYHSEGDSEDVRIVEDNRRRASPLPPTITSALRAHKNRTLKRSLDKIVIKKNAQNRWELERSVLNLSNPGPSTSTSAYPGSSMSRNINEASSGSGTSDNTGTYSAASSNSVSSVGAPSSTLLSRPESPIEVVESEDDECQVVEVLKPKSERTPEIVDLSSDEEVEQTLINVSSGPEYSPRTSPIPFFERPLPRTMTVSPLLDWRMMGLFPRFSPSFFQQPLPSPTAPSAVRVETPPPILEICTGGYSSDCQVISDEEANNPPPPGVSSPPVQNPPIPSFLLKKKYCSNAQGSTSTSENKDIAQDLTVPKKKLSSAIVRPWAIKESPREVASPKYKRSSLPAKEDSIVAHCSSSSDSSPATFLGRSIPNNSNEATTSQPNRSLDAFRQCDNYPPTTPQDLVFTEDSSSDERPSSPKKLKLRSVVAHFSFDSSGKSKDSGHRSSHKKHKDKKKKKKLHKHKRKHRILSDSDSN